MADLYDSLFGDGLVNVHNLQAAVVEYMVGEVTRAQIASALALDPEAVTDLDVLLDAVDVLTTVQDRLRFVAEVDAVNHLAEQGLRYTTKAAYAARLGL